jgi:hypothetical protein
MKTIIHAVQKKELPMPVVDTNMPNYFAGATTILTNAQEQAALAAFGYRVSLAIALSVGAG